MSVQGTRPSQQPVEARRSQDMRSPRRPSSSQTQQPSAPLQDGALPVVQGDVLLPSGNISEKEAFAMWASMEANDKECVAKATNPERLQVRAQYLHQNPEVANSLLRTLSGKEGFIGQAAQDLAQYQKRKENLLEMPKGRETLEHRKTKLEKKLNAFWPRNKEKVHQELDFVKWCLEDDNKYGEILTDIETRSHIEDHMKAHEGTRQVLWEKMYPEEKIEPSFWQRLGNAFIKGVEEDPQLILKTLDIGVKGAATLGSLFGGLMQGMNQSGIGAMNMAMNNPLTMAAASSIVNPSPSTVQLMAGRGGCGFGGGGFPFMPILPIGIGFGGGFGGGWGDGCGGYNGVY